MDTKGRIITDQWIENAPCHYLRTRKARANLHLAFLLLDGLNELTSLARKEVADEAVDLSGTFNIEQMRQMWKYDFVSLRDRL